jgi:D-alanyl-D-alanine carboxypeptidase
MKINLESSEKQIISVMVILAVVSFFYIKSINQEISKSQAYEREILAYEQSIKPFLSLALDAKGFAIYNPQEKNFLYKKNAEEVLPLASLAKVMTAIIVLENVPEDKIFTISKESLSQAADHGLLLGEKWKRDELIKFALFVSSNDAVHQLAIETGKMLNNEASDSVQVFVSMMNKKAEDLGLSSFVFNNESGLDITNEENGAYGSARDMAKLFAYAIEKYPEIFSATKTKTSTFSSLDKSHNVDNTNTVVEEIDGILASKTGYTAITGGNLIVATKNKEGLEKVIVVMGSTYDARFTDMKTLTGATARFNQ